MVFRTFKTLDNETHGEHFDVNTLFTNKSPIIQKILINFHWYPETACPSSTTSKTPLQICGGHANIAAILVSFIDSRYFNQFYTAKNEQVVTSLFTSCNNLLQQADIRMRLHGLRQLVDDKSVASCQQTCCKLMVQTCYAQACCKSFQQILTSLQVASWNKPVILTTCNKCMALLAVWSSDQQSQIQIRTDYENKLISKIKNTIQSQTYQFYKAGSSFTKTARSPSCLSQKRAI